MGEKQLSLSRGVIKPVEPGSIEKAIYSRGYHHIAGLDEAGRGPLAGPVVAAAVILPRGFNHPGIKDSKALTAPQREAAAAVIRANAVSWAIGVVEVEEIDRLNILKASLLAMVKACQGLQPAPDYLLVDGRYGLPAELFCTATQQDIPAVPEQTGIVKGDRLCVAISAASILAKVSRDELMRKLDNEYPEYGFAKHKGYGSAAHLEALRRLGPSPVHRKSFKPVRELCGKDGSGVPGPLFTGE